MIFPTGRLPAQAARLQSAPSIFDHMLDVRSPPDKLSRSGIDFVPTMGDNWRDPDCTAESLREVATAIAAAKGGYRLNVARAASLQLYCQVKGLPSDASQPQIQATDGAIMLDVAQFQLAHGFNIGPDLLRGLWGTVPVSDRTALAVGAAQFAALWGGILLYQRDMDMMFANAPLDDDGSDPGDLVGAHAIMFGWEYTGLGDTDEVTVTTYGIEKPAKWRWLKVRNRLEEAHAFRFRQLDPAGASLVDEETLSAALAAWSATA